MVTSFHPITKEAAAGILSVSKRTIENLVAKGEMPPPISIGRRVYWHPDAFYSWLNSKFGKTHQIGSLVPDVPEGTPTHRRRGRPRASVKGLHHQAPL